MLLTKANHSSKVGNEVAVSTDKDCNVHRSYRLLSCHIWKDYNWSMGGSLLILRALKSRSETTQSLG